MKKGQQDNIRRLEEKIFVCGRCNREVSSIEGWHFTQIFDTTPTQGRTTAWIYIC